MLVLLSQQVLGAFMHGCYGSPLERAASNSSLNVSLFGTLTFDRVRVSELIALGQLVRAFTITSSSTLPGGGSHSQVLFNGTSIGASFVYVSPKPVQATSVTLTVTALAQGAPAAAPYVAELGVYLCGGLARQLDEEWERQQQ